MWKPREGKFVGIQLADLEELHQEEPENTGSELGVRGLGLNIVSQVEAEGLREEVNLKMPRNGAMEVTKGQEKSIREGDLDRPQRGQKLKSNDE